MTASAGAAPDVSVIVPAYNTAPYIAESLASVFAQTRSSWEVVVVNDGSPDTLEMRRALEPFAGRITYLEQENRGIAAARNVAIAASRGRYIALLDSDDIWEPNYLAVQVAALEADPTLDVVYPDARLFGDHPHSGRTYMEMCPSEGDVTIQALLTHRCSVFVGVLARRAAIVRAGLFDPELRSVEDFDLWLRILAGGGRIGYHRQPLVRMRKHRASLSADPINMASHVLRVLDKAARALDLSAADRAALERRRDEARAVVALTEGKRAFFRLDRGGAVAHLRRANQFYRSRKLSVACMLVRTAPDLLLKLYRWRDRLLVGTDTTY